MRSSSMKDVNPWTNEITLNEEQDFQTNKATNKKKTKKKKKKTSNK
eukprot:CAMPEP_0170564146 /NCGR_PEP_ID=MMETSP0211-20121228/71264_1 /TAXON_ID=311385 /ORGANISM="Pseudokeronopsis sp., Strain OXSARD2" /LENGTH=45 /DNA_ID= /DNA_START= /DNA_END= /DNA_ORIENTATION=